MPELTPKLPVAAITDEFSPTLSEALPAMRAIGMTGAELRTIDGKNILDLTDDELKRARDQVKDAGVRVVSIASPLGKCVLPGGPELDLRFQHDAFASTHAFARQEFLADRAVSIARFFEAPLIRVFSFWRTVRPQDCRDAIINLLDSFAERAAAEKLVIGLENEHACNVATAAEAAEIVQALPHPALQLVWDPANAVVAGENAFPAGYALLPVERISHVHAKDCRMNGNTPVWLPLGTGAIPWKEQLSALYRDGYRRAVSLETHWRLPGLSAPQAAMQASTICGWNLRGLLSSDLTSFDDRAYSSPKRRSGAR